MASREQIRTARTARKLSQRSLARAVKVSQTTISNLEKGIVVSPRHQREVEHFLGLPADPVAQTDHDKAREELRAVAAELRKLSERVEKALLLIAGSN